MKRIQEVMYADVMTLMMTLLNWVRVMVMMTLLTLLNW